MPFLCWRVLYRCSYHSPAIEKILCCSSPNSRCGCLKSLDDILADASLDFMRVATAIAVGRQPTSLPKSAYIASSQRLPVISYLSRRFELFGSANDGYPTPISSLLMKHVILRNVDLARFHIGARNPCSNGSSPVSPDDCQHQATDNVRHIPLFQPSEVLDLAPVLSRRSRLSRAFSASRASNSSSVTASS